MGSRRTSQSFRHGPIILILLLAAYLRWAKVGGELLSTDGTQISLMAIDVGRRGRLGLIGAPMSAGTSHSPFTIYLYALPFRLSPDIRIAIMFSGAMNVLAVALAYSLGARYFSRPAGWIGALLYAVHPEALQISRQVLNTVLGPPFVMAYVLTGLLGYYDGKKWARILHLPMLSLAAQCHPHSFLLAPITPLLVWHAWVHRPPQRLRMLRQTAIGGTIAVLLLMPWGLGVARQLQGRDPLSSFDLMTNRGWAYTVDQVSGLISSWEESLARRMLPPLTVAGALWLLIRAMRRKEGLPGLVVVLAFLLIPTLALAANVKYRGTYFYPAFGSVFVIQGALLGGVQDHGAVSGRLGWLWNWRGILPTRYLSGLALLIVAVVSGTHLRFFYTFDRSGGRATIDDYTAAVRLANHTARQSGREALILVPYGADAPYDYLPWELLNEGRDSRVIWHGRGLPLPANGAVLLGPADYVGRPFVFSGGRILDHGFRLAELPAAEAFKPDLPLLRPVRFSNGGTVVGFLRQGAGSLPQAGQVWTTFMIWRVDEPSPADYKVFVHLVDGAGDKYAQQDLPALPVGQQRPGELVMNQFDLQLGEGLPPSGPLYLRFGMYSDAGPATVMDDAGGAAGDYGLLQVRGQARPLAVWDGRLALDQLATNSPLPQGPPLAITATWHVLRPPLPAVYLRWRLLEGDGAAAFEESVPLLSGVPASALPAGMYTTHRYGLRIPTDLAAGTYSLEMTLADGQGQAIGEPYQVAVEVTPRERRFNAPAMTNLVGATFGDQIRLLGYDLAVQGEALRLVLHWQAIGQIGRDYKYFVHVWREGQVVAQADAMPGAYQYPTSWWAPNEVYREPVTIDLGGLESGTYAVTSGFYDPVGGERLPAALAGGVQQADRWVTLTTVSLP